MNPEAKLTELGLTLPTPPAVAGSYVPTVRTGNLLYCAGTICLVGGQMTHTGQVGKEQTVQTGYKSAEICALNTLANIKAATGSLEKVARIVFVSGFVNAVDGFTESPAVINVKGAEINRCSCFDFRAFSILPATIRHPDCPSRLH